MRTPNRILSAMAAAALAALVACTPARYELGPVRTTGAEVAGAPASVQSIPPEAPRGDVRLAIFGLAAMRASSNLEDPRLRAVHVALVVSNRSEEPWTVEPAEQRLQLSTAAARSSIEATTLDAHHPSAVAVPPRSTRWIDLYFALPIRFRDVEDLPPFDVIWTVRIGERAVTERARFDRFLRETTTPARYRGPEIPGQPSDEHPLLPDTPGPSLEQQPLP